MTTSSRLDDRSAPAAGAGHSPLYSALVGLASLAVLLQGLWAGLFVREGKEYDSSWVEVHARGAEVALVLAAAATVVGFLTARARKDLWIGSAVLTVLIVVESYLGGEIGDKPNYTTIHIPLAMALMALVVWLPLRARRP